MKPGATLLALCSAPLSPELSGILRDRRITVFFLDRAPDTPARQAFRFLPPLRALSGYYALILGAAHLQKSLSPLPDDTGQTGQVLILGLDEEGQEALTVASKLGASISAWDPRADKQTYASGTVDTLMQSVSQADLIVTAYRGDGQTPPLLLGPDHLAQMKPGSVIVDLCAEEGGNCQATRAGETVLAGSVIVIGPTSIPSCMAAQSSQIGGRSLLALLRYLIRNGKADYSLADPALRPMLATEVAESALI